MLQEVYITRLSRFLPNKPILNDEMEQYIGLINEHSAKSKRIVLRNNGIKCRYYALDKNGNVAMTFNTEGMYRGMVTEDGEITIEIYK